MKLNGIVLQGEWLCRLGRGKGWFSGSCLEPVPHLPTQGIWQLSAPENHLWTQESIFLLLRGALGREEKSCCRMKTNAILIGL